MTERRNRISAVDALRGLAALAVVFFHSRFLFFVGGRAFAATHGWALDLRTLLGYATLPLRYGFLGVNLFFVLSGYCIHRAGARSLQRDPGARLDVRAFALRRLWRIYPTYVFALLLTAAVDVFVALRVGADASLDHSPFALAASLLSLQGYVAPQFGSNGVFWTLSIELHLYALYPLLHWISRRLGPRAVLAVTGAASLAWIGAELALDLGRLFPYRGAAGPVFIPYWLTWAVGFYLAEAEAGRAAIPRRWAPVGLAAGALGIAALETTWRGAAEPALAVFFGAAVWWSLSPRGREFWENRVGRWLAVTGAFSYSLYAVHVPVLLAVKAVFAPGEVRYASVVPLFAAGGAAIVAGWLAFSLVERWTLTPLRARGARSAGGAAVE